MIVCRLSANVQLVGKLCTSPFSHNPALRALGSRPVMLRTTSASPTPTTSTPGILSSVFIIHSTTDGEFAGGIQLWFHRPKQPNRVTNLESVRCHGTQEQSSYNRRP